MGVMNMLIGVVCEVVSTVASCEKEGMLIQYVTSRFRAMWESLDSEGSDTISKEKFLSIMTNREAWTALQEINVDPMSLVNLVDLIFESEDSPQKSMDLNEVMDVILSFRGTNTATVKDINDLRKWFDGHSVKQLERHVAETERILKKPVKSRRSRSVSSHEQSLHASHEQSSHEQERVV